MGQTVSVRPSAPQDLKDDALGNDVRSVEPFVVRLLDGTHLRTLTTMELYEQHLRFPDDLDEHAVIASIGTNGLWPRMVGACYNKDERKFTTPVHICAVLGWTSMLRALMNSARNPEVIRHVEDDDARAYFEQLATSPNTEGSKFPLDMYDGDLYTPLAVAATANNESMFQTLLMYKARIDVPLTEDEITLVELIVSIDCSPNILSKLIGSIHKVVNAEIEADGGRGTGSELEAPQVVFERYVTSKSEGWKALNIYGPDEWDLDGCENEHVVATDSESEAHGQDYAHHDDHDHDDHNDHNDDSEEQANLVQADPDASDGDDDDNSDCHGSSVEESDASMAGRVANGNILHFAVRASSERPINVPRTREILFLLQHVLCFDNEKQSDEGSGYSPTARLPNLMMGLDDDDNTPFMAAMASGKWFAAASLWNPEIDDADVEMMVECIRIGAVPVVRIMLEMLPELANRPCPVSENSANRENGANLANCENNENCENIENSEIERTPFEIAFELDKTTHPWRDCVLACLRKAGAEIPEHVQLKAADNNDYHVAKLAGMDITVGEDHS